MRIAKPAVLSMLAAVAISSGAASAELSQQPQRQAEDIRVGQGVVCDTAQQVERLTALLTETGLNQAVSVINKENNNPLACAVVMAAFVRGDDIANVRTNGSQLNITEITIVAVPVEGQWHFVAPLKQYTVFKAKGVEI